MTNVDKSIGRVIRDKLDKNELSQMWLIAQLGKRGVRATKTTMSSALRGTRKGPAVDRILEESKAILEQYESFYK